MNCNEKTCLVELVPIVAEEFKGRIRERGRTRRLEQGEPVALYHDPAKLKFHK